MQPVKRYSPPYFDIDKIEAHWDKQVYFWKRRHICRFTHSVSNFEEAEALRVAAIDSGALQGVVANEFAMKPAVTTGTHIVPMTRGVEVCFAFPDKRSAMLFKLSYGGGEA
ncbi:hypothetical protein [Rhizobium sp. 2MFCol3.1]|uniref:hypothetical protein n=1 Tax=Rhizobium sp. 2MFCol3.1 TaxID=1246459 RepID=UPI0003791B0B|nr:hypothetical protein [Rhizobium sp. 2MFCol3.1]